MEPFQPTVPHRSPRLDPRLGRVSGGNESVLRARTLRRSRSAGCVGQAAAHATLQAQDGAYGADRDEPDAAGDVR